MTSVTERSAPLFGSTISRTLPSPEPVCPSATVTHETVLAAVHVHPPSALTAMLMSSGPRPEWYRVGLDAGGTPVLAESERDSGDGQVCCPLRSVVRVDAQPHGPVA